MRRRSLEKDEQILAAATALFAAHGYAGVTVADIAARAGVGLSTLYLRFPSKEALGNAVLRRCKNAWAGQTLDNWPEYASPAEQFTTYWDRLHAFARTRPDEARYAERRPFEFPLDQESLDLLHHLQVRSTTVLRRWTHGTRLDDRVAGALIHGAFWGVFAMSDPPRQRTTLLRQARDAVWRAISG